MGGWAGIALALRGTGDDDMQSRLPTYLHPLAGRVLAWHLLQTIAELRPHAQQVLLAAGEPIDPSITGELPADVVTLSSEADSAWHAVRDRIALEGEDARLLFVDGGAVALSGSLERLVAGPAGRALRDGDGRTLAVWIAAAQAERRCEDGELSLEALGRELPDVAQSDPAELFVVTDRAALARAGRLIRDRLVRGLMEDGATFLLPETVLVDVDVSIEPDTVIYPGVVLEGQTSVGSETVVGPGCRIIDSRIGSGVELKGWNYIVGTSIRNRAVLEPYVRRGHD